MKQRLFFPGKPALQSALRRLRRKLNGPGPASLLLGELEPRILYSAAPVESSPAEQPDEPVQVASALQAAEPSAANPGSLANALEAPAIRVIDALRSGDPEMSSAQAGLALDDLTAEAARRWEATGLTQAQREALSSIRYEVRDIGGATLAFAEAGTIVIDDDAGGSGWFVDPTPGDDAEFAALSPTHLVAQTQAAQGRVDLLTVLMHEQGHVVGLADSGKQAPSGDLMRGEVPAGARLLPSAGQTAAAVPGSLQGTRAATLAATVWINEFHYDNSGSDVGEFIEVAGVAGTSLAGWSIYLYNGANGQSYGSINLSGTIDNEGGTGYGALTFSKSGIQEGAPDGIALVNNGTVVEFLSYEGTFSAINGPAAGMRAVDIGVAEASSTPVGHSLQRDNSTLGSPGAWYGPSAASAGTLNSSAPAMFSIAALDAAKAEGNSGATNFTFTVTRSGSAAGAATVNYAVTGAGVDASDFSGNALPSGTVSFADGEASRTLTIAVQGDLAVELNENFTVTLSNPSTGVIATAAATGTIQNDDSTYAIAALDAAKAEGNGGATAFTFTVTRSGNTTAAATVDYSVTGSGADAADFAGGTLPAGTVSFAAGETSKTLSIAVAGDLALEADEGFVVTLSNPSAGTVATASASATIRNDDSAFAIAALDSTKAEGNAGATAFTFVVTRSGNTSAAASVDYSLSGSEAGATDFTGDVLPAGTVSFAAGETSRTLIVEVRGDLELEGDEAFAVTLSNPSAGTIVTHSAAGTIRNDDSSFAIVALDAAKAEGNSGPALFTFTVSRNGDLSGAASIHYAVTGAGANGADFAGGALPAGVLNFAAGENSKTLTIAVQGDAVVEAVEDFTVTLSSPSTGTVAAATASASILNDDAPAPVVNPPAGSGGSTPAPVGKLEGYAPSAFDLANPTFGMPSGSTGSVFAGFLSGSVMSRDSAVSGPLPGLIRTESGGPGDGPGWSQGLVPVLAGYTNPQGGVRFSAFDADGFAFATGSGYANDEGAFLILVDLSNAVRVQLELAANEIVP